MDNVGGTLFFDVSTPTTIVFQVAAAYRFGVSIEERLDVVNNGVTLPVQELPGPVGGRQHLADVGPGLVCLAYDAKITRAPVATAHPVTPVERVEALRPSRFCPSDRMTGFARSRFDLPTPVERVRSICDYVRRNVSYVFGTSEHTTDAAQTLLSGQGVCRDFAHLVAALCRAVEVPARIAGVYAPGLWAMDLHAVVETEIDGFWQVWDATRAAPRMSLVRIATGRDAADIAFASVLTGGAQLTSIDIQAFAAGELPFDDHEQLVALG
jgi:transglutaminase-like putative cysteine protease